MHGCHDRCSFPRAGTCPTIRCGKSATDVTGALRGFEEPELIIMDTNHQGGPGDETGVILLAATIFCRA
ncbi:hypothetical protein HMPREF1162_1802 [ [[Propionibacterium] namnetense SK182B-JCVI]|uniref:Uncharacterized protein n=1 Tax=[Propionibacterium] namnetense SK182B-JCVI TaxID=1051006 RepID=F9NW70_9ACTN|nr:hypothetical protein HMPREF1162_1802 [ [[Propionibacterium] namnetense SK182B-JCVI]